MKHLFLFLLMLAHVATGLDYSSDKYWVFREKAVSAEKTADVFYLCPTVTVSLCTNMDADGMVDRMVFRKAVEGARGIYADKARFFAPYYRQKTMSSYGSAAAQKTAYEDVKAAFLYYLKHENNGRPFILAGHSQGSEQALHLMEDVLVDPMIAKRLVAAYLIGWCVTPETVVKHPWVRPALGEKDTGVFISWNTESEDVSSSVLVPSGVRSLSINPLNWRTDGTRADAEKNLGAKMSILSPDKLTPKYCGAVINTKRGTLNPIFSKEHPAPLNLLSFGKGVYHAYDTDFFYENLRRNVKTRIKAYNSSLKSLIPSLY